MTPAYFPLRWESTGDQWWFVSPIDWAAANGHYDLVRELLHLDTNLLIRLTSLRRIHRLEIVWDDEEKFPDVAKCRAEVAKKLLLECETNKSYNTLIRAGYGGWLLYTAASAGDVDFVRHILERDPRLVFGEGEYGVTDILYAAARSKNSKVFRVILDSALSPWGDGSSAGEIEEKEHEGYLDFRSEIMNRAVHAAARGGNLEFLKEILEDDYDVLVHRDDQGSNILHSASARGQVEVVKYLLATSCEIIKTKYNQGNTALHISAYKGHLGVVEILLSASPSLAKETNNHGDTFLHMAIAGFHAPGFRRLDQQMALMKELLRCKFVNLRDIINARNNDGRTALHMAVTENVQSDIVELLMSAPSINLNVRDAEGNTALDLLKQRPRSASSQILIKQLIAAGGISNCKDHTTRKAIASNLKMQGIGGSPGTSFRIPDAEIFLHTGIDNDSDGSCEIASTKFTACSGHLSICSGPPSIDSSNSNSVNKTTRRLKMLLHWKKKKERKQCTADDTGDDNSVASYNICTKLENNPIPLRQRFSRGSSSLPNNKRFSVQDDLPSPSSKKKFAAGLMQGVIQLMPRTSFETPSSPFSGSSLASPMSVRKVTYLS